MPTYEELGLGVGIARDRTHELFGQVMGLVALTAGCAALGAYIARNMTGGSGLVMFIGAFACIFGLQWASRREREQLAIGLLFGLGLFLGMAVGPVLAQYAKSQPAVLWQAAGSTAAFTGALGAAGYATRRDLSAWARFLFWGLLALIVFGIVGIFVAIPHGNLIYCIAGLAIFGAFTVFDFNRLRQARGTGLVSAVPIAASIFLDIFNVFLFMLRLFGGGARD